MYNIETHRSPTMNNVGQKFSYLTMKTDRGEKKHEFRTVSFRPNISDYPFELFTMPGKKVPMRD